MIKRTLQQIQNMIEIKNNISSFQDVTIHGVTIDSRKIQPGNLFIPFKGEHSDGHIYVEAALKSGAAAALLAKGCSKSTCKLTDLDCRRYIRGDTRTCKKLPE